MRKIINEMELLIEVNKHRIVNIQFFRIDRQIERNVKRIIRIHATLHHK